MEDVICTFGSRDSGGCGMSTGSNVLTDLDLSPHSELMWSCARIFSFLFCWVGVMVVRIQDGGTRVWGNLSLEEMRVPQTRFNFATTGGDS